MTHGVRISITVVWPNMNYNSCNEERGEVSMSDQAKLILNEQTYEFPTLTGSEGEKGIEISTLRGKTKYITLDNGFMNTGACESKITYIDGDNGILRYYGIPIEQLAEKSTFIETAYLLLHGNLPRQKELTSFSKKIIASIPLHRHHQKMINCFPAGAHPMCMLGCMINAMASFHPHVDATSSPDQIKEAAANLIGRIIAISGSIYRKSSGDKPVPPQKKSGYCENFLHLMFGAKDKSHDLDADIVRALEVLFILHADHEQNCSTSSVRLVGSSHANLYAAIAAGVAALWGPLHGGANQAVIEMLTMIQNSGENIDQFIDRAKNKADNFRLSGFGHRVYKNYDPRAKIIKKLCMKVLQKQTTKDPLLEIAVKLEERVLKDDYFIKRKLYPNVDFYSGLLYKAMGIPVDMFTVMFAIGRMPGWIAQWQEMVANPATKIGRPRQIYTGNTMTKYTPMSAR